MYVYNDDDLPITMRHMNIKSCQQTRDDDNDILQLIYDN